MVLLLRGLQVESSAQRLWLLRTSVSEELASMLGRLMRCPAPEHLC